MINVVAIDDHKLMLDGIRLSLTKKSGINFLAEFEHAKSLYIYLEENHQLIDVVITDMNLPDISGEEITVFIKKNYPQIKVLMLTAYDEKSVIERIVKAEADGYLTKNINKTQLVNAVKQLYNDGTFYTSDIRSLIEKSTPDQLKNIKEDELTPRELEVIKCICDGLSSKEIAEKLFLSIYTVNNHRKNIIKKTGAKTAVAIIKYAIDTNLF